MNLKRTTVMASPPKVTLTDRNNLDRFIKMLSSKTVQVIVQSRLGEKIKMKSKPQSANADWFNLTIEDNAEIATESRRAFASLVPTVDVPMCVEISVRRTVEGDTLILEVWQLEMLEQCDSSVHVSVTVYNRIGQLLKSLISICRVLPGYRVACQQTAKEYVVCYRVYMGEPDRSGLGDKYLTVKVGHVGTPVGTLSLSVGYRTLLAITDSNSTSKYSPFMVKSDHFKPDLSPKRQRHPSHQINYPIGVEERQDSSPNNMPIMDELASASEDFRDGRVQNHGHTLTNGMDIRPPGKYLAGHCDLSPTSAYEKLVMNRDWKKFGAFARETKVSEKEEADFYVPDVSFSALLRPTTPEFPETEVTTNQWNIVSNKNCANAANLANNNAQNVINCKPPADDRDARSVASDNVSQKSDGSAADDFVLVELRSSGEPSEEVATEKTPFGQPDRATDLGVFFRECQSAPPLMSFSGESSLVEQVTDLSEQLAKFEVNQHEFDVFVESLCHDDGSK